MLELIGWLASLCFALCSIPQALQCYRQGHGIGLNKPFMWIWLAGELLMMPYVLGKHGFDGPIMFNLTVNTFFIIIILKYIYFPREN